MYLPKSKKGLTVLTYTMEMGQESPRQLFVVAEIPIASCRTLELDFKIKFRRIFLFIMLSFVTFDFDKKLMKNHVI